MADAFYPFVEQGVPAGGGGAPTVRSAARIAVYDDVSATPRVLVVEPADVRSYLEEITSTVTRLTREQGGAIPFMVIREIVENLIHAYFTEPIISILDGGNTIRFADQGPGIADKELAMEYGTTSATDDMKRYIRGVGSGLPYARQWLSDKGGSLRIEDNVSRGTVVTITLVAQAGAEADEGVPAVPDTAVPAQAAAPMAPAGAVAPGWQPTAPWGAMPPYAPVGAYPQAGWAPPQPQGAGWAVPGSYAPPYLTQPTPQAWAATAMPPVRVSERGMMALGYLSTHESVGPTELVATFGHSQPTWTRELQALEDAGLVAKRGGQKRHLTPAGQAFLMR